MIDFSRSLAFVLLVTLVATSCTEANLYSPELQRKEANRLSLEGRVCTEDPVRARFPVRVVLLVDQAAGPLYGSYDPGGTRLNVLTEFVQDVIASSPKTKMSIVGYAGRPKKLAPTEGDFTRNPGELFNAVTQLSLSESCVAPEQCRDYRDGIRTARALIEGELATMPAGARVLTQFAIIMVNAGPQEPLADGTRCCAPDDTQCIDDNMGPDPACDQKLATDEIAGLKKTVDKSGAAGFKFHAIHLAAEPDTAVNDQVAATLKQMVFAGSGEFQRFNNVGGFTNTALDLLELRTVLRAKLLMAANLNARPGPEGPLPDTDADGLSDAEEEALGTDPGMRDTDGDGVTDRVEVFSGLDPLTPDPPVTCEDIPPGQDQDIDFLTDCDEELLGTEPTLVDSDGDGMPDALEVFYGTDYVNADSVSDIDGDGVTNGDEMIMHTDPRSTDVRAHLTFGYRYDIEDEGITRELFVTQPERVTGVEIVELTPGTTAGVGILHWDPVQQTLQWQDAADADPGPPIDVSEGGTFELPSSSYAPVQQEEGKLVTVEVTTVDLPPDAINEQIRVVFQERQCLSYSIRNIRMMATGLREGETQPGINDILLYFAQAPDGRNTSPGPFRMAQIPVRFEPPATREPPDAVLKIKNNEFVRPKIQTQ